MVFCGIGKKVFDFLHFLDGLIDAGDVGELDIGAFLERLFRLVLAKAHLGVVRLHHLGEEEEQQRPDEDDGQNRREDADPTAGQLHFIGDAGMLGHQAVERTHVCGGVTMLGPQLGLIKVHGVDAGRSGSGFAIAQSRHTGVEGAERVVERIGGSGACRDGRVIGARHRVIAGAVHNARHAILLDRLNELRSNEVVGGLLRVVLHREELLPDEKRDKQEQHH